MNTTVLSKIVTVISFFSISLSATFAGGPLNLNSNDPDNFSRWPNGGNNIPFNPDLGNLGPLGNDVAVRLTTDAFQRWQNLPSATATYRNNGSLPIDINATNVQPFIDNLFNENNNADGLSPIIYDEDGSIFLELFGNSGVLGFASPDTFDSKGVPTEGVALLNGNPLNDNSLSLNDFFAVLIHEFGHYSGMAHTVVNGQNIAFGDPSGPSPDNTFKDAPTNQVETMYPFIINDGGQETLHIDDIAFYSTLYPTTNFFASTGTINGTIIAPNGITRLSGVNIIARNTSNPFVDAVSAISGDRGIAGEYTINGLTPGADYAIYVDEIISGGFSTDPLKPLPAAEEFYNGTLESGDQATDDPFNLVTLTPVAGTQQSGVDIILNGYSPGTPLPVGDDNAIEIFLPFVFTFCGQDFQSVFINANGSLTFGAADLFTEESTEDMFISNPRIAGIWDDLNPTAGGNVTFESTPHNFTAIWTDIPEYPDLGANSFEITLKRNFTKNPFGNYFAIAYKNLTLADGLSGYSCGSTITSALEKQSDLSDISPFIFQSLFKTTIFEQFTETNTNDLNNSFAFYFGTRAFHDHFEPNNTFKSASWVDLPFSSSNNNHHYTDIARGNDVDYYKFYAEAGNTLVAEVRTGNIDSIIGLFDEDGNLIASDDDGGSGLRSRLLFEISTAAHYRLAVTTYPDTDFNGDGDGDDNVRYVLDISILED